MNKKMSEVLVNNKEYTSLLKENNKLYELIDRIVNSISNKYDGLSYEKLQKIAKFIGDELKK